MSLKDRMYELTSIEDVVEFMDKFPTGAFFKAGGCHKTMQGFGYVEQALNPRETVHLGFVRVIENRPVSNYIAEITQVIHQSPQLILYIDKKPVYDVDNWNITLPVLQEAFLRYLGPVEPATTQQGKEQENRFLPAVSEYIQLLKQFIQDQISESEFRQHWLLTFQKDATPRSTQQFNLLNSLFGDVDQALSQPTNHFNAHSTTKDRAKNLLKELTDVFS